MQMEAYSFCKPSVGTLGISSKTTVCPTLCNWSWSGFFSIGRDLVGNVANARKRSGLVSKSYYARRSDVCFLVYSRRQ